MNARSKAYYATARLDTLDELIEFVENSREWKEKQTKLFSSLSTKEYTSDLFQRYINEEIIIELKLYHDYLQIVDHLISDR